MKLKEKITIDFELFFTTGKFDFLKLGQSKEWIINNFPDPDGFDEYPEILKNPVWRYGNIELHFLKDELFLIFSDYINTLDGGDSLELKKWFLEDTEKLNLSDVISILNGKHIDFRKITNTLGQRTVSLELNNNVSLGFSLEEKLDEDYEVFLERCKSTNQNEFRLGSFSLTKIGRI